MVVVLPARSENVPEKLNVPAGVVLPTVQVIVSVGVELPLTESGMGVSDVPERFSFAVRVSVIVSPTLAKLVFALLDAIDKLVIVGGFTSTVIDVVGLLEDSLTPVK